MVFSLMAVGYAIRVFSLLQVWLKMWATKSKSEANDISHGGVSSFWQIWQLFKTQTETLTWWNSYVLKGCGSKFYYWYLPMKRCTATRNHVSRNSEAAEIAEDDKMKQITFIWLEWSCISSVRILPQGGQTERLRWGFRAYWRTLHYFPTADQSC